MTQEPAVHQIYKCRLASINDLTPTLRELKIEVLEPKPFEFKAGQFIMLQVPEQQTGKLVMRAYSIASDDREKNKFTLLIKLLEQGKSSDFIRELNGGEELLIKGPFGKLFFKIPSAKQAVLLCTGAGLSQHMSFLLSHIEECPDTKFSLLLGVWNENEIFYKKELDTMKARFKNFSFDYVVDKPLKDWKGKTGFVTDFLDDYDYKNIDTHIYLCGNPNMIKNAKGILIEENSFPPDRILAEAFG